MHWLKGFLVAVIAIVCFYLAASTAITDGQTAFSSWCDDVHTFEMEMRAKYDPVDNFFRENRILLFR
jgi:hypothetical protein